MTPNKNVQCNTKNDSPCLATPNNETLLQKITLITTMITIPK
jgi:hypothetical protein